MEESQSATDTDASPAVDRPLSLGIVLGTVIVVVLSAVAGTFGYLLHASNHQQRERDAFADAARRGAVAFTSLDYHDPNADIARVLAMSTGAFRDDFELRSRQFASEALSAKRTTIGSVTQSGIESINGGDARVLVALIVTTKHEDRPDSEVHSWRLRISVTRMEGDLKIENVSLVS